MKDNMSFATDNWEEFEKLSISILETYLPADSEISYSITHTPNRKDGAVSGTYKADGRTENNRTPITPHPRHWHKTSIWNELLYS